MKKPLSGELLQNNLVEKNAHIRHPRNTANTSAFGLPEAKHTVKHAYFQPGSVSAASSLKSEQQENIVNYMVFTCRARNYPLPPPSPPHPPANPNPKSGTPSTAAKSSKAQNNCFQTYSSVIIKLKVTFTIDPELGGFWPGAFLGASRNAPQKSGP